MADQVQEELEEVDEREETQANQSIQLQIEPAQLLRNARYIRTKYDNSPAFGVRYLEELLQSSGLAALEDETIDEVRLIIQELTYKAGAAGVSITDLEGNCIDITSEDSLTRISQEIVFRKEIEEFYLPKQLIDAIMEIGQIPKDSIETVIGIGFIDIADYTFLSKFLSPKENQVVLNGLYTAFNWVLQRHGGYLNKIEGDSLMFHFGGIIDPKVKGLDEERATKYIARELFYTCIEMQRVCILFNQASDRFIEQNADEKTKEILSNAFAIISGLRNNLELSSSINALFQIRIRVGADIGEVTIGNFGPDGAKQWDVIGLPVIYAKRMESTAPVGGLRISEHFYNVLEKHGIVDAYFQRFRREALALGGTFRDISKEDLFKYSTVILTEKKDAVFRTFSVQVNSGLPESIADQVKSLSEKGSDGADKILEILQYYRGNRYVIDAIELGIARLGIDLRKGHILEIMFPKKYEVFLKAAEGDADAAEAAIGKEYSLFHLFEKFGTYQDIVKPAEGTQGLENHFVDFNTWFENEKKIIETRYKEKRRSAMQGTFFYQIIYPLVFTSIRSSILEYQHHQVEEIVEEIGEEPVEEISAVEEAEEADVIEEIEEVEEMEEIEEIDEDGIEIIEDGEDIEEIEEVE